MGTRQIEAFFHGLYMDARVLRDAGTKPSNLRRAYVADFALRIAQYASLVNSPGSRTCGMLITLTHAELDHLYSAPGLERYRPEASAILDWKSP